jgi:hypothetical protein
MEDKMANVSKTNFGDTGIMRHSWVSDVLTVEYYDGGPDVRIDPRMFTMSVRNAAMQRGVREWFKDNAAVLVAEFPDRRQRAAEARRRNEDYKTFLYSGTDTHERKAGRGPSGPSKADVLEAIVQTYSKMALSVMGEENPEFAAKAKSIAEAPEELVKHHMVKRNLDEAGSLKYIAESREVAQELIEIKHKRAIAAAANRPSTAQELLTEMMG